MTADPRRARQTPVPPPPPPPPPSVPDSTAMALDGASDLRPSSIAPPTSTSTTPLPPDPAATEDPSPGFKLRFCTVCASNQNRSMEAHLRLSQSHYPTISFGTGSLVRLPGPSISQPNVYPFNSPQHTYAAIHDELAARDPRLYAANGLLPMLARNRAVKRFPERWHDWVPGTPRVAQAARGDRGAQGAESGLVDVVVTCEERCWDAVVEDLHARGGPLNRPVHVVNVDIRDNHEEALVGGRAILDLAERLNAAAREERERAGVGVGADGWEGPGGGEARQGFDERVPEVIAEWQERWPGLPALWTMAWF